jgi:tetratricopeptide (TPR) repeat protein
MIRDFDESGGRPLRGAESFKRPVVHEGNLEELVGNEGQASALLEQVLELFKAGRITQGVRRAKDLARWLEGQPYLIYCGNLGWLLWHMSTYAPPAVARRMLRDYLNMLPCKGSMQSFAAFAYLALARVHRRRGDVQRVRACLRYVQKRWADHDMHSLAYLPYYYLGELLHLEGKHEEALPLIEKSLAVVEQYRAFYYWIRYDAQMLYAQILEALDRREEAHAYYARFLERFGDHSYMSRSLHEKVWDGFHRTREPVRPKF